MSLKIVHTGAITLMDYTQAQNIVKTYNAYSKISGVQLENKIHTDYFITSF